MAGWTITCGACQLLLEEEKIDPAQARENVDQSDAEFFGVARNADKETIRRAWQNKVREAELGLLPLRVRHLKDEWIGHLTEIYRRMLQHRGLE